MLIVNPWPALEAPGSDAALAQEGPALPPQCVLAPDEISQLIEAGHLPPQAEGGGDYGAGTASPATPPAQVVPTRSDPAVWGRLARA